MTHTHLPSVEKFIQIAFHLTNLKFSDFKDCYNVKQAGKLLPGIYQLQIDSETKVETFCEAGGWTVIQSRGQFNNSKDYFSKLWHEYEIGFGVPGNDF